MVRTSGFHPDNGGSIPPGDANIRTGNLSSPFFLLSFCFCVVGWLVKVETKLSDNVIRILKDAISENNGNEISAYGLVNPEGVVVSAVIGSRGSDCAAPLTLHRVEAHVLIHNHPSGVLEPSEADLEIASRAAADAKGFYIINNDVTRINAVVEPIKLRTLNSLDPEKAAWYLSEQGPLAATDEFYEERPSQLSLIRNICSVFNDGALGVFEAGTGVGKSFAYLIPALLWIKNNNERVVVSTGTINLQQQLAEKDVPAAQKILGTDIKFILLKGRQNYVCRRRFSDVVSERDLFTEETEELDSIAAWLKTTETGTRSELTFMPSEGIWSRINSESDACMGMKCPFREDCFVMKLRKEAADAQLIIVNHHLLFADIEMRQGGAGYEDTAVLPPYQHLVFDEAHGIEDAATSFFSETINRYRLQKQLNLLYRQRRGNKAGLLFTVDALASAEVDLPEVIGFLDDIKLALQELEDSAMLLLGDWYTWRLEQKTAPSAETMLSKMQNLRGAIAAFAGRMRTMLDSIPEEESEMPPVWECRQIVKRIESCGSVCQHFVDWNEHEDMVFWMEKRRLSNGTYFPNFIETPLDISNTMYSGVFEPINSIVCTSATLKTAGSFQFWKHRTGVLFAESERVREGVFPSPFPYRSNVLLSIVADAPDPKEYGYQAWLENTVVELIRASKGRCLVLFTSYDSLKYACNHARNALSSSGITVLKQGDDDRFRLLEQFRSDSASVLFATDSFWEGVDVPGESLSHVVIVKLPFPVPSDPVFAARSEDIEKRGGSSFFELSVPQAIIHFRQGFGRLMRRASDRGVVTVLDGRLLRKNYGRMFVESVPETKQCFAPLKTVLGTIERFLS